MSGEDFLTVSNRGRMAFFLICAEQALIKEGRSISIHPRWALVIEKYWNALGWSNLEELEGFLTDFKPSNRKNYIMPWAQWIEECSEDGGDSHFDDELEWNEVQTIFNSESKACYFLNFMDIYYTDGIYGASNEPRTVRLIDEFLSYIKSNYLSVPSIEKFQQCERGGEFNFGDPVTRDMFFTASEENDWRNRAPFKWFSFFWGELNCM